MSLCVSAVTLLLVAPPSGNGSELSDTPSEQSCFARGESIAIREGSVYSVAFSCGGGQIAVGVGRCVELFHATTGERLHRLEGHMDEVQGVAFSRDGALVASACADKTIRLWRTDTGELVKSLAGRETPVDFMPLRCAEFFPDGRTLAACGTDNYITLWDIATGSWNWVSWTNHNNRGGCTHVAISPDGKWCAVSGARNRSRFFGQVSMYKVNDGLQLAWHREHEGEEPATHVAFSPDGRWVLSSGHDKVVRVWEVESGRAVSKLGGQTNGSVVAGATFLPDGKRVVSVGRDETIHLWDVEEARSLATIKGRDPGVRGLALSPDGTRLATCGEEKALKLWLVPQLSHPIKGR